jgi:DNA invertase Pin-like site-specific DNA recombinase
MIRVQPYYRRSRRDAKRGISIEVQQQVCERYSELQRTHGQPWQLLQPVIGDGQSAYHEDWAKRPDFLEVLEKAKRREYDVLLVYMFDRFSRKTTAGLRAIELLLSHGVKVYSASELVDYNTPFGRKQIRDLLSSAEFYSDLLSQRMQDVRRTEAERGVLVGPVPDGYARINRQLVQTPAAVNVRLLGELYASGAYSYQQLAEELEQRGVRNSQGKPYALSTVREMLDCPVYAGFVWCRGEVYQGTHEPIWSAELWARIQAVRKVRTHSRVRTTTHSPLLGGLIRCACCGAPMRHNSSNERRYYRCAAIEERTRVSPVSADLVCCGDFARAVEVEAAMRALLGRLLAVPWLLERLDAFAEQQRPARRSLPPRPSLADLKARFLADEISAEEYERLRQQLATVPAPVPAAPAVDTTLLRGLIAELHTHVATVDSRVLRPVLGHLATAVYARRSELLAIEPTEVGMALIRAAVLTEVASGGPGGLQAITVQHLLTQLAA